MNVRVLKNDGFTLIELILVVILVGIVAAVAIPRFADLSDEAHNANTQATSQAFQAATVFVHSAWIARGRSGSTVQLVGATVDVNSAGWPGHNVPPALNNADCVTIWGAILQNAPPSNVGFVADGDGWGGIGASSFCFYIYQPDFAPVRYIRYNSINGEVLFFII